MLQRRLLLPGGKNYVTSIVMKFEHHSPLLEMYRLLIMIKCLRLSM